MIQRQLANNKLATHLNSSLMDREYHKFIPFFSPKKTNLPSSPYMTIMTTCVAKREFAVPFLNYNN